LPFLENASKQQGAKRRSWDLPVREARDFKEHDSAWAGSEVSSRRLDRNRKARVMAGFDTPLLTLSLG